MAQPTTVTDTSAARALYERGNEVFNSHADSAFLLYGLALEQVGGTRSLSPGSTAATWRLRGSILNNLGVALERLARQREAIQTYHLCLEARDKGQDRAGLRETWTNLAVSYRKMGDTEGALDANQRALALARELADQVGERQVLINLALIHQSLKLEESAEEYYEQALSLTQAAGDEADKARILNGLGGIKQRKGDHVGALEAFREALVMRQGLGDQRGIALAHHNLAHLLTETGQLAIAKVHSDSCTTLRTALADRSGLVSAHALASRIALLDGRTADATRHAASAWEMAMATGSLADSRTASLAQYRALAKVGRTAEALAMLERHIADRDSMDKAEGALAALQDKFRMDIARTRLQDSLNLVNERALSAERITTAEARARYQRYGLLAAALVMLVLGVMTWSLFTSRRRSERLLLNILPAEVAAELKSKGSYRAVRHQDVTVLFADFVRFTEHSNTLGPEELVAFVDRCFSTFDGIMERHGLEKIKTVGDAYLAVSGLPRAANDHAVRAARAALDMVEAMVAIRREGERNGVPGLQVRVGLHSGPVVAGIVGLKKFQYDIWGDTVNTAARIQAASDPDRVCLSEATMRAMDGALEVEPRGLRDLKGKGPMALFFLRERG